MATGTNAGLLAVAGPQSVYKHAVLDQYAIRFAAMATINLSGRRAVVLDGFAGRGRHDNGTAASAETLMAHALRLKNTRTIDLFLVERAKRNFVELDAVAEEYRAQGITVETRRGNCQDHLDEAERLASGAVMFLFLDPCGANIPYDTLAGLVGRRGAWPRTELLMNFSADLIRRVGGQLKAGRADLGGAAAVDRMCGGDWWRDVALDEQAASSGTWESAAQAVATEYAGRLAGEGSLNNYVIAPVRRQPHYQPVYYLVFLTADPHGLWVFNDAASKAREDWLRAVGPDEDLDTGRLFPDDTVDDQIAMEERRATVVITRNLLELVSDGRDHRVVDDVGRIYGEAYGEAREKTFSAVLRQLVTSGDIEYVSKANRPHGHVIRGGSA